MAGKIRKQEECMVWMGKDAIKDIVSVQKWPERSV